MNEVGLALGDQGKHEEAEALLELREKALSKEHPYTVSQSCLQSKTFIMGYASITRPPLCSREHMMATTWSSETITGLHVHVSNIT